MSIVPMKKDDPFVLQESRGVVVADFYADWCGPCRSMAQVLREVSETTPETVICAINVDERPEIAKEYGVTSIPTLLIFRDGAPACRLVGLQSRATVTDAIARAKEGCAKGSF